LKTSDKILNDERCYQAAKKVDPVNHQDLFNECWLKIREIELKDVTFNPTNYYQFFFRTLKNQRIDDLRTEQRHNKHNKNWKILELEVITNDYSFDEFLINWLADETDDEVINFYKDIIFLVLHNKTIKGLVSQLNMKETTFYKHYKTAKEILKHDYITSADNCIFFDSPLV